LRCSTLDDEAAICKDGHIAAADFALPSTRASVDVEDGDEVATRMMTTKRSDKYASFFSRDSGRQVMHVGSIVARLGLVTVLVVIGGFKFAGAEAHAVQRFVTHSPFFAWMDGVFGIQGTSNVFGVYEIITGLLIAARFFSARLSSLGSAMAIVIFLGTLTFLVTTPDPFVPGGPGQFLLKDITLLGASIWTLGEAMSAGDRVPSRADS